MFQAITEDKYEIIQSVSDAAITIKNTKEPPLTLTIHLTSPVVREEMEKMLAGGMEDWKLLAAPEWVSRLILLIIVMYSFLIRQSNFMQVNFVSQCYTVSWLWIIWHRLLEFEWYFQMKCFFKHLGHLVWPKLFYKCVTSLVHNTVSLSNVNIDYRWYMCKLKSLNILTF